MTNDQIPLEVATTAECRYFGDKHVLIIGSPGSGKTASLVIPNLKQLDRSMVVIDVEGRLAAATAKQRSRIGTVHVLDLFNVLPPEFEKMESSV